MALFYRKDSYLTAVIGEQLYYHKFLEANQAYQILWQTEEYDFDLMVFGQKDPNVCFPLLRLLRVERDYTGETPIPEPETEPSPVSSVLDHITTVYTLDIPNKDRLAKKSNASTSFFWVWKTTEGKTVSFTQTLSRSASFYERRKKEGEEIVRDGLSYYFVQKENESGYHVFWDTGEYGFELFLEGETDKEAYFAIIQTLHIDVPPPQKEDAFFRFTQPNGDYFIAQYIGSEDDPKIPAFYRGLPVSVIDIHSFQNCTFLTTIHIPASIQQIQFVAFEGCVNLKTVKK